MKFKQKLGYMVIGSKSVRTLCVVLLTLSVFGCTMFHLPHDDFHPQIPYIPPDIPKSKLATIEIDATSRYHITLIEVRVDNRLAVRQEIDRNKNMSIDDVLVTAGEHNITARFITATTPRPHRGIDNRRSKLTFSYDVDLKAGGTYRVFLTKLLDGGLYIDFIDKETNKSVGKKLKKHYSP